MTLALLKTKLYVPSVKADLVQRPRLIKKLTDGLINKLTLISAPAGFGKTVLLSEWAATHKLPVAWVSLDASDEDPSTFWTYFITALQTIKPDVGASVINVLRELPSPPTPSLIATHINSISEELPEFAMVLDDFHLISTKSICDSVAFLLDHLPLNMHLIISSRADPALPLARLRANNQLTELRVDDLRFTGEEAESFFRGQTSNPLSKIQISTLVERTEGWGAGLRMSALSVKGHENVSAFIATFNGNNRYILDYLSDEVLARQDESVRSFLLHTSVLERMNSSLCDAVTGRSDSQNMLEQLEAANLFVVPLDDERKWFRYHHLFVQLLRNQLKKTYPDLPELLYRRASTWFECEGFTEEVIQYSLAGKDFEKAASLIESIALELVVQNRAFTVSEWIIKLPEDTLNLHPKLCVAGAWASLALRRLDNVEKLVYRASVRLPQQEMNPQERNIYFNVMALRAFLARFAGDYAGAIEFSLKALDYAKDADAITLSSAKLNMAVSYWNSGDLQTARKYIEEAYIKGKEANNYYCTLISLGHWANIETQMGHLSKAVEICGRAVDLGRAWGGGDLFPTTGYALVSLSEVLVERNQLVEGEAALAHATRLGEASTESELLVRCYLSQARIRRVRGDLDGVSDAFTKAFAVKPVFAYLRDQIGAYEAQSFIFQGKVGPALAWAENNCFSPESLARLDHAGEVKYLTGLRIKLASGKAQEVVPLLESFRTRLETKGTMGGVIETLILLSLALGQSGKAEDALENLERVLNLAEPEGYLRVFVDAGDQMLQLLRLAERKGIARDYVRTLLLAFQSPQRQATAPNDIFNNQERKILQLMSSGLSNKDIAKELFLSLNTVKWYSSQLYSKLGVNNRTEAVKRARDMKLF